MSFSLVSHVASAGNGTKINQTFKTASMDALKFLGRMQKPIRTHSKPLCYWLWTNGRVKSDRWKICETEKTTFYRERENRENAH